MIVNDIFSQINLKIIQLNEIISKNILFIQKNNKDNSFWDMMKDLKWLFNDVQLRFDKYRKLNLNQDKKKEESNIEEHNEEGLVKENIITVMEEGKCSREAAIKALKIHNGDVVEAILEVVGSDQSDNSDKKKKEEFNNVEKELFFVVTYPIQS